MAPAAAKDAPHEERTLVNAFFAHRDSRASSVSGSAMKQREFDFASPSA